jgi:hypothetical protein
MLFSDLSRAMILREFRDYVLNKNRISDSHLSHDPMYHGSKGYNRHIDRHVHNTTANSIKEKIYRPDNIILVGVRSSGAAGGKIIDNLCVLTQTALQLYEDNAYAAGDVSVRLSQRKFRVECIVPSDLSFLDEIQAARKAKIIITVHGTISYLSLFSRDGTQQISIANPKEFKENQILLYATHTQLHYLTWDRMNEFYKVLTHAITLSNAYYFDN